MLTLGVGMMGYAAVVLAYMGTRALDRPKARHRGQRKPLLSRKFQGMFDTNMREREGAWGWNG